MMMSIAFQMAMCLAVAEDQTGLPVEKRPVCCLQKNLQAKKVITEHREV
jgi:hypothetical protein